MSFLLAWLGLLPLLVGMIAVVWAPGLIALRTFRVNWPLAVAAAPALTCGVVGASAALLSTIGLRWGWLAFTVILVLCHLVPRLAVRGLGDASPFLGGAKQGWAPAGGRAVLLMLAAAILMEWAQVVLTVDPLLPNPSNDPLYHYNGVNAVMSSGDASTFGAMDYNYGLRTLSITYPAVWHALAALLAPVGGIVPTAHVFAYLVIPMIFLGGLGALASQSFRRLPLAAGLVPVVAVGFAAFPGYLVLTKGFWPNALAIAVAPGFLALMLATSRAVVRAPLRGRLGRVLVAVAVLGVAGGGIGLTHPSIAFTLLWVGAPALVAGILVLLRRARRAWGPSALALRVGIPGALALVMVVLAFTHPQVQGALTREATGNWEDWPIRIAAALANWPVGTGAPVMAVVGALYISLPGVGAVVAWRSPASRWIIGAWAMQFVLVIGTYLPVPLLSAFVGLWYSDVYRFFAMQTIFASLLIGGAAAAGLASIKERAGSGSNADRHLRYRILAAGTLLLSAGHMALGALLVANLAESREEDLPIGPGQPIGTEDEMTLIAEMDEVLPQGAIVVGDAFSGIGYAPAYGDVESVYTQGAMRSLDVDGAYLAENFDDIGTDPTVCTILRYYGIEYFYEDDPVVRDGVTRDDVMPGFYEVDTSEGFELVAEAGTARLWRIEACGQISPADRWWSGQWRRRTIIDPSAAFEDDQVGSDPAS